jgi:hypothetical protein
MPLKLLLHHQNLLLPIRSLWSCSSSAAPSATPSSYLQSQANPVTTHHKPSSSTPNPTRCKNPDSTHTLPKSTQKKHTHTQIHSEEESYQTKSSGTVFSFRNPLPISNLNKGRRRRIKHTRQKHYNNEDTKSNRENRLTPPQKKKRNPKTKNKSYNDNRSYCLPLMLSIFSLKRHHSRDLFLVSFLAHAKFQPPSASPPAPRRRRRRRRCRVLVLVASVKRIRYDDDGRVRVRVRVHYSH